MITVVLFHTEWFSFTERQISTLRQDFPQCSFFVMEHKASDDALIAQAEIMVGYVPRKVIAKAKRLKWLHLPSAGAERYADRNVYPNSHVILTNSSGGYGKPIAEQIIGYMIALTTS